MTNHLILAIDQGTGSTKGVVFNHQLHVVAAHAEPIDIESPQPGWVQQDANQIWQTVRNCIDELAAKVKADPDAGQVSAVAITNQRESALAWSLETGEPLGPMLGWQDRRTAGRLNDFTDAEKAKIEELTGLPLDPMFSALKFEWLLDQLDADRSLARAGKIALGTVDSWLVFKLTGEHRVEIGNASRTQLLDISTGDWSEELLDLFNIPVAALPRVAASDEPTQNIKISQLGAEANLAVSAILADSHAALFAHSCQSIRNGNGSNSIKATFGTGSSIMALTASAKPVQGLVRTVAWSTGDNIELALEGNILSSGSTVVWLGKLLGKSPDQLAELAAAHGSKLGEVNLVPAFGGLGAPWWDSNAEAIISGLTLGVDQADLARAAFESITLQIEDVVAAAEQANGSLIAELNVDGGPTTNDWLMQLQANISGRKIVRNEIAELSAAGVASFAGWRSGLWPTAAISKTQIFEAQISADRVRARKDSWQKALNKSRMQRSNI